MSSRCEPTTSKQEGSEETGGRQQGMVLLWFALSLTVLLGCCGFAIDVGRWYFEAQHLQKAADAAALYGVVSLPGSPLTAQANALAVSKQNGYTNGLDSVLVQPCPGGAITAGCDPSATPAGPTEFQVTVTKTIPNFFAQILGVRTTTIRKSAIAEYEEPVAMGSPANIYGNEALLPSEVSWNNSPFDPNLWGNLMGPQSNKSTGDAIQAGVCDGSFTLNQNCAGTGQGQNNDYNPDGYVFKITANASLHPGQQLNIQVFDPAAIHVGDHCDQDGNKIKEAGNSVNPYSPVLANSRLRYDWGDTTSGPTHAGTFCTGDNNDTAGGPDTTIVVRKYDHPGGAVSLDTAVPTAGCSGVQFQGYGNGAVDLSKALNFSLGVGGGYIDAVAQEFRQWVTVCSFTPDPLYLGSYILQIRTNIKYPASVSEMEGAPTSPLPNTGGSNRFSLRAAWFSGGAKVTGNSDVNIAGVTNMGLYANAASTDASPNFYMARVLPPASLAASVTLEVKLWDIGDCACSPGDVNLAFTLPGATLNCSVSWHSPANPVHVASSCTFPTDPSSGTYNGQSNYLVIDVSISHYTCDPSDASACWVRMNYGTGGGALNDTTTWSAAILGDPVRLVQ
jgi:hypothetical protein